VHHLAESNTNQVKEVSLLQDNNSVEGDDSLSKMAKKLMKRHRITSKMAKKLIKKLRLELAGHLFTKNYGRNFPHIFDRINDLILVWN